MSNLFLFYFLFSEIHFQTPNIIHFQDSVRFTFYKKGRVKFEKTITKERFTVKIENALISPPYTFNFKEGLSLISKLEIYMRENFLIFDFYFTPYAKKYRIKDTDSALIVVFTGKLPSKEISEIQNTEKFFEPKEKGVIFEEKKEQRKIERIVIDPGHGGKDPGAIGKEGTMEKDINLSIAKILKKEIEKAMDVDVILTREEDIFIPLGERTQIANKKKASIFMSIHCNASKRIESRGPEVYFLSEAKTDYERAVAALENASLKYEIPEYKEEEILQVILMDIAQAEFLKESSKLAELLQESLISLDRTLEDRGMKQAGFYVLNGAYMPAVLIEIGFITNPEEEKLLKSSKYQKKIAEKILEGIKKFKEWYE